MREVRSVAKFRGQLGVIGSNVIEIEIDLVDGIQQFAYRVALPDELGTAQFSLFLPSLSQLRSGQWRLTLFVILFNFLVAAAKTAHSEVYHRSRSSR